MAVSSDVKILIRAQNDATKELKRLQSDIGNIKKGYNQTSQTVQKENRSMMQSLKQFAPVLAGAFAVHKIIDFGKELVQTSIRLDQMQKKASTVLGEFEGDVRKVANEVASSMGLTRSQFVGLTTDVADLLVPLGFTRDEASKMSLEVTKLSGALAEWSGGTRTAEESADALRKAMLGEREMLKTYGVKISEADVAQRLLDKGMQDLTGSALEQQKAIATLELAMERSTDAQTAFKNGGDSLLRTQNELKARLQETKETMAMALQPTIQSVQKDMLEWTNATLKNEQTQTALTNVIDGLGKVVLFVMKILEAFVLGVNEVSLRVSNAVESVLVSWYRLDTVTQEVFGGIKDYIMGIRDSIVGGITNAVNKIINTVNKAVSLFNSVGSKFGVEIGQVQPLAARANGGPVSGGSPYLVGERGPELFVPKSSGSIVPNNKMGNTININVNVTGSGDRNFAGVIVEEIKKSLTRDKQLSALGIA